MKSRRRKLQIKRLLRERKMSDKKNDGYSCQFSEDVFFEQYKIYVEEIIEKYLPADECQYEEFADMIADSVQKKRNLLQLKMIISTKKIDCFLDLLLDNSLNFNVELFYPEGRIEKNGPLSKVLFKNYQVIIDGYRLQTLTIKKLKDKLK